MKLFSVSGIISAVNVLPLAREWIEIRSFQREFSLSDVLPLAREWIEMFFSLSASLFSSWFSLLRGSGLKYSVGIGKRFLFAVLPLAREWIEIFCLS